MSTSQPKAGERVTAARVTEDSLEVDLLDGRTLIVPLAWYPRLLHATAAQRANLRIIGGGSSFIGPISMSTFRRKACSPELLRRTRLRAPTSPDFSQETWAGLHEV